MSENKPFWLLTVTVFVGLLVPFLVQEGMFVDGITYSAIAKNMAHGLGSLWVPHYTQTLYPAFYEHPPLVFIVQSWFFRLFGDGFYTERIFSFTTALGTAWGIICLWKLLNAGSKSSSNGWLPVLLWISVPLIAWSYQNNILENTMSVFGIFSVFYVSKSLIKNNIIDLLFGSILVLLALLSKGAVGLFPMAVPLLYAFVFKEYKKSIIHFTILLFLIFIIASLIFYLFPALTSSLIQYAEQQLIPSFNNKREVTTTSHFSILINLLIKILFPLLILLYFAIKSWAKDQSIAFFNNRVALFFLLIAVSASLPLMLTLKQRDYYLVPSIPFYMLAISAWLNPFVNVLIAKINTKTLKRMTITLFALLVFLIFLSIVLFGKFSRDKERLNDIYAIGRFLPPGTVLMATDELCTDWYLVAYLSRTGYLSLDCNHEHQFYLANKDSKSTENFIKIENITLQKYTLYKNKNIK